MAEKEFINFEEQLEEVQAKVKESELEYESKLHYLKGIKGELTEENFKREHDNTQSSQTLSSDITALYKEKDQEVKLRMEAEKQVELALQKTKNIEQRLNDWKDIQEINLKDAINTITKVSNNLHNKLEKEYESKTGEIKNQLKSTADNIYEYLDNIVEYMENLNEGKTATTQITKSNKQTSNIYVENYHHDLEDILQSYDLKPNTHYLTNHMLDQKIKKSIPCDFFIFPNKKECIIIDSKALKIFLELSDNKVKNSQETYKIFEQKIDHYIKYLTKAKYKSNIVNYFISRKSITKNTKLTIVMLIPLGNHIEEMKKIDDKYLKALQKHQIQLLDVDDIGEMLTKY